MKTTNKSTYVFCLISVLVFCLSVAGPGMAQVPKKLNYQGYLQDNLTGEPVTGTVQMDFALYDVPTGGSPLWSETQQVDVNDGRYSVHLGAVTPLILTEAKPYYLRISFDGEVLTDDNGEEYREELTSGLYAVFLDGESGESPANNGDFPRLPSLMNPLFGIIPVPENTFYGMYAGVSTTTGRQNTFIGDEAGRANTTGGSNTFIGDDAGWTNFIGDFNTFIGHNAGRANTFGNNNTFVGDSAGLSNMEGVNNTFIGYRTGMANIYGNFNTFVGIGAGQDNSTGDFNTFVGNFAGLRNTNGHHNTLIGTLAGGTDTNNNDNTFVGFRAGQGNFGDRSVFLGYEAGSKEPYSQRLYIHNSDSSTPLIYGEFDAPLLRIHGDFYVTGNAYKPGGGSWTSSSDQRLKDIQQAFTSGLEAIEQLQPVSYRYKPENPLHLPSERSYVGVVAQEVQQVIPEAVEEGEDGYLMVNNDPIIWTMLNAIKELKAQDDVLKAQNEALKAQNEMMKKEIELLKKALGQ